MYHPPWCPCKESQNPVDLAAQRRGRSSDVLCDVVSTLVRQGSTHATSHCPCQVYEFAAQPSKLPQVQHRSTTDTKEFCTHSLDALRGGAQSERVGPKITRSVLESTQELYYSCRVLRFLRVRDEAEPSEEIREGITCTWHGHKQLGMLKSRRGTPNKECPELSAPRP